MRSYETLKTALAGIDKVFLLSSDHPEQADIESGLIDMATNAKIHQIVKISAFVAGLDPPISFGNQLVQIEKKLQTSGFGWTILRPYVFMQNFLEFADLIATRHLFMGPFGKGRVSMVDTRDVALVAKQVLLENNHIGKIYEITGPEPISFYRAAEILTDALGHRIRFISVPSWIAGLAMRREGVSKWEVAMRLELFKLVRADGEINTTNVIEEIGKATPRRFEDFVKDHLSSFQGASTVQA